MQFAFFTVLLCGCREPVHEYEVLMVPSTPVFTTGERMEVDLYMVRKLGPDEARVKVVQDEFEVRHHDQGYFSLNTIAHKPAQINVSGSVTLLDESKEISFSGSHWVVPPPPSVTSRVLIRGRRNPVAVGIPGIPESKISVAVTNAQAFREGDLFHVVPGKEDTVKIMLYYESSLGTKHWTDPVVFEVFDMR